MHSQELLECATIALYACSTSSDHWLSCPFDYSWHIHNGTSSDSNSSDEVLICFLNGFIYQLLHVPPEEEIQTCEVRWPWWPGHRATSANPSIPEGGSQMMQTSECLVLCYPSVEKALHVHCCCNKAVMIATESMCFQADLREVLNVSTHSHSATPIQQLTSAPLTKCSLTLQVDFRDHTVCSLEKYICICINLK